MRKTPLLYCLALLTATMVPDLVRAWEKCPIKIDTEFRLRFNVRVGPSNQCKAPWYSYFPYDPNLQSPQGGNPYPNWPSPFPPAEGSSKDKSASRFPTWPSTFPGAPGNGADPLRSGQPSNVASSSTPPMLGAQTFWQTSFSNPSGMLTQQPQVNGYSSGFRYGR